MYDRCNVYAIKVYEDASKQEVFVHTHLYVCMYNTYPYMWERKMNEKERKKALFGVMCICTMYSVNGYIYADAILESAPSLPIVLEREIKKI